MLSTYMKHQRHRGEEADRKRVGVLLTRRRRHSKSVDTSQPMYIIDKLLMDRRTPQSVCCIWNIRFRIQRHIETKYCGSCSRYNNSSLLASIVVCSILLPTDKMHSVEFRLSRRINVLSNILQYRLAVFHSSFLLTKITSKLRRGHHPRDASNKAGV